MAIWDKSIDRRDFLKTAAGAAAAFAAASILPKQGFAAPRNIETAAINFSEMEKLSPTEMAKRSPLREYGYNWLMDKANGLQGLLFPIIGYHLSAIQYGMTGA